MYVRTAFTYRLRYQKILARVGKEFPFDIQAMRGKIYRQFFGERTRLLKKDNTAEKYSRMGNGW